MSKHPSKSPYGCLTMLLLLAAVSSAVACSDATGPSRALNIDSLTRVEALRNMPDDIAPQFQKVYQGGGSGGHGGGASGACEFPQHMSGDCVTKGLVATAGFFGMLGVCGKGLGALCAGAATGNSAQWIDWSNTPDANGHTHSIGPNEYFGGPMYPIGGPGW